MNEEVVILLDKLYQEIVNQVGKEYENEINYYKQKIENLKKENTNLRYEINKIKTLNKI